MEKRKESYTKLVYSCQLFVGLIYHLSEPLLHSPIGAQVTGFHWWTTSRHLFQILLRWGETSSIKKERWYKDTRALIFNAIRLERFAMLFLKPQAGPGASFMQQKKPSKCASCQMQFHKCLGQSSLGAAWLLASHKPQAKSQISNANSSPTNFRFLSTIRPENSPFHDQHHCGWHRWTPLFSSKETHSA